MDRRTFVIGSAAGGAALLGGSLSARAETAPTGFFDGETVTAADMNRFLAKLDGHLGRSRNKQHLPRLLPDLGARLASQPGSFSAADREDLVRGEALYQKTIRSLLLVGSMRDLPLQAQVHPGMQARVWGGLPEMSDALTGTTDYLNQMSGAERIDLARALREEPDLVMRTVGAIDEQAAYVGIPHKRRSHLREMAKHVAWRFQHQGANAVIDEYSDRIEKARTTGPATFEDLTKRLIARIGERAYWSYEDRVRRYHAEWIEAKATSTGGIVLAQADPNAPPGYQPYQPPPFAPPPPSFAPSPTENEGAPRIPLPSSGEPPGHTALVTAAWMLGISGLSVAIGLPIFFTAGIVGAIVGSVFFTQAGLTLIGGLIALFVGLAQRSG